jgi:hypothetical protein
MDALARLWFQQMLHLRLGGMLGRVPTVSYGPGGESLNVKSICKGCMEGIFTKFEWKENL